MQLLLSALIGVYRRPENAAYPGSKRGSTVMTSLPSADTASLNFDAELLQVFRKYSA
jgi:hypothetical protein